MRLESYQKSFAAALLSEQATIPHVLFADGPRNELAWRVYRNNVHFSLMTALSEAFPVVHRLLGEEGFAALAQRYVREHPPASPVMVEYGEAFPEFLRARLQHPLTSFVPDAARLDWLYLQAQHAADAPSLDPSALGEVPLDDLARVQLRLHPSVRTFLSPIPAVSIWQANKRGQRQAIHLDAGAEAALLLRPVDEVHVLPLAPDACAAVAGLVAGHSIERACSALPEDLVTQTLACLLQHGAITDHFIPAEREQ